MKLVTTMLLLLFSMQLFAQQATVPTVSLAGIGVFKIGMKKAALDKLLPTPVKLRNLVGKDAEPDTVQVVHEGIDYELVLATGHDAEEGIVVYAVKSKSPLLKTRSGIGIGDDKLKIISTYEDYTLQVAPDYHLETGKKQPGKSILTLYGEETPTVIFFTLEAGKVTSFTVMYNEGC